MRYVLVFALTALLFSLTAPGSAYAAGSEAAAGLPAPVDVPDECYCAECGMYVRAEHESFSSEIIFKDGKVRYFCDLGDMMIYYEVLKKPEDVAAVYVKDHITKKWIDGRSSFYLTEADVTSPMRFGYLAFADMAGAQGYRLEHGGGKIYTFQQIIASRIFRR